MKAWMRYCYIVWVSHASYAAIYTWKDNQDITHFSDRPAPGAKRVHMQAKASSRVISPPSVVSSVPSILFHKLTYEALNIIEPLNEATIRNPQGYVPVQVALQPGLRPNDQLQLVVDGQVVAKAQQQTVFSLMGLERGSHEIYVQVIDEKGNILKKSHSVTVFMMQPKLNQLSLARQRP